MKVPGTTGMEGFSNPPWWQWWEGAEELEVQDHQCPLPKVYKIQPLPNRGPTSSALLCSPLCNYLEPHLTWALAFLLPGRLFWTFMSVVEAACPVGFTSKCHLHKEAFQDQPI